MFNLFLTVRPTNTTSNAQNSGLPVSLALGKHQAGVLFSVEPISGEYPSLYPVFEPWPLT